MENIKTFLESSTIHGLTYISTTRKLVRLFWITVVISGFFGAGYLIYTSFQTWDESPIKTTIETRPITELTFPKVTVCPPKNTFTVLNYDLLMVKQLSLDNSTREELVQYAAELLNDELYNDIMKNLSMLENVDRYYNWYYGYTRMTFPSHKCSGSSACTGLEYEVETCAPSGTISTQFFGEEFNVKKVGSLLQFAVHVKPPRPFKSFSNGCISNST